MMAAFEADGVHGIIMCTFTPPQERTSWGLISASQRRGGETFKGHPVKVLASYGPQQVLEGDAPEGVVIVEFPSTADARAWYDSPAYQEVAQHRFKGARYRAVLVEGV